MPALNGRRAPEDGGDLIDSLRTLASRMQRRER
jgi:hypothetical protein